MEYKVKGLANDMTVQKSMRYGLDECLTAMHEAVSDLTSEEFHSFPKGYDLNIVVHTMHCLQQVDDFNGNLQEILNRVLPYGWRHMEPESRYNLWGISREEWPKPGDTFPSVGEAVTFLDILHADLMKNIEDIDEDAFINRPAGKWPRMCDMFFRAIYHLNSHIREIWMIRGILGVTKRWPVQHYA